MPALEGGASPGPSNPIVIYSIFIISILIVYVTEIILVHVKELLGVNLFLFQRVIGISSTNLFFNQKKHAPRS